MIPLLIKLAPYAVKGVKLAIVVLPHVLALRKIAKDSQPQQTKVRKIK